MAESLTKLKTGRIRSRSGCPSEWSLSSSPSWMSEALSRRIFVNWRRSRCPGCRCWGRMCWAFYGRCSAERANRTLRCAAATRFPRISQTLAPIRLYRSFLKANFLINCLDLRRFRSACLTIGMSCGIRRSRAVQNGVQPSGVLLVQSDFVRLRLVEVQHGWNELKYLRSVVGWRHDVSDYQVLQETLVDAIRLTLVRIVDFLLHLVQFLLSLANYAGKRMRQVNEGKEKRLFSMMF